MRKLTLGILALFVTLFTSSFAPIEGDEEWKDVFKKIKAEVETNYDPIEPVIHFIKEATPPIQQKPN